MYVNGEVTMAHFAKIENNLVVQVIVINNENCDNLEFPESEKVGKEFIKSLGIDGEWLQTSYNSSFRKNYAGILYTYDPNNDVFIPPQPYPSWTLDRTTYRWSAPKKYPEDEKDYIWSEEKTDWITSISGQSHVLLPSEPDYEVS